MYVDKLDDVVNKHNNTYHCTIKMKLANPKLSTYIDFDVGNNHKDPKYKNGENLKIPK